MEEIGLVSHLGDFLTVVVDGVEEGVNEELNEMEGSLLTLLQRFDQAKMLFEDEKSLETLNREIMEKSATIYQASFFNKFATKFASYNSE